VQEQGCLEGVKAEANVATKTVDISFTGDITDKQLVAAVTDAGYTVKSLV
jgi:copper chaperone CopZ